MKLTPSNCWHHFWSASGVTMRSLSSHLSWTCMQLHRRKGSKFGENFLLRSLARKEKSWCDAIFHDLMKTLCSVLGKRWVLFTREYFSVSISTDFRSSTEQVEQRRCYNLCISSNSKVIFLAYKNQHINSNISSN